MIQTRRKNIKKRTMKETVMPTNNNNITVPKFQRAVVFQGGGALGAYEAGVFRVLYHWRKKDIQDNDDENIFDIVAGTSIGAINATILVSHFLERKEQLEGEGKKASLTKCWEGAPEKLVSFWKHVSSNPNFYNCWMQNLIFYWLKWLEMYPLIKLPSREAFRRYLTTRGSLVWGSHMYFHHYFSHPFLPNLLTNSSILHHNMHGGIDTLIDH
jgi:NTE family protein